MKNLSKLRVSELSKRGKRIKVSLKPHNRTTMRAGELIKFIMEKENCSKRTAYRVMTELHEADQIADAKMYTIGLNR